MLIAIPEVKMLVGFFADDGSAFLAAQLANSILSGGEPERPDVLQFGGRADRFAHKALDDARIRGGVTCAAMPLSGIEHMAIRARLDLAVVTAGPGPVYGAVARRTVLRDGRNTACSIAPAWLYGGPALRGDDGVRRLPVDLAPLGRRDLADLRAGCSCGKVHRQAVGLVAALRIAADDPFADRIDPAEIAELITPDRGSVAAPCSSPKLREELLDLAAELTDGARRPAVGERRRRMSAGARGPFRRSPVARREKLVPITHSPGCVCAIGQ